MKYKYISLLLAILIVAIYPIVVFAHPGRLDKDGGHYNRTTGEYHYHDGLSNYNEERLPENGKNYGSKDADNESGSQKIDYILILVGIFLGFPIVCILFFSIQNKIKKKSEYKKRKMWEENNPDAIRRYCLYCPHCKIKTIFYYDNETNFPINTPSFCKVLRREISDKFQRCMIAEPPNECLESETDSITPPKNQTIYISTYGKTFHSKRRCPNLKKSKNIYKNPSDVFGRTYCKTCWKLVNSELKPK